MLFALSAVSIQPDPGMCGAQGMAWKKAWSGPKGMLSFPEGARAFVFRAAADHITRAEARRAWPELPQKFPSGFSGLRILKSARSTQSR